MKVTAIHTSSAIDASRPDVPPQASSRDAAAVEILCALLQRPKQMTKYETCIEAYQFADILARVGALSPMELKTAQTCAR